MFWGEGERQNIRKRERKNHSCDTISIKQKDGKRALFN